MHPTFAWGKWTQTTALWTGVGPAFFSLVTAVIVLVAASAIWINPQTRANLRRQSLQMLLCVQGMSLLYSSTYLVQMFITGPTVWCNVVTIITLFASNFIDFVIMFIPVNLQLFIVHHVRTEGFVRYYLLASLGAAIATALPGSIKPVWGWDPETQLCWIAITEPRARISWLVGAWYAWLILSMGVATISTTAVLLYLVVHTRSQKHDLGQGHRKMIHSNWLDVKRVASKITLYPSVLIVVNCISEISNFIIIRSGGIKSDATYALCVVSGVLYGLVPSAYALITLFIDPSFTHALRTLLAQRGLVGQRSTRHKQAVQIWLTTQVVGEAIEASGGKEAQRSGQIRYECAQEHSEVHTILEIGHLEPVDGTHLGESVEEMAETEAMRMDDMLNQDIAQL